jgi:hypothetical protein
MWRACDLFTRMSPDSMPLNAWFSAICEGALDHEFESGRTNNDWLNETRPLLPRGWAAILYLFNMR